MRSPPAMSALATIARILGAWAAISVLASPILVLWVRAQARLNAGLTCRGRREAWIAAQRA